MKPGDLVQVNLFDKQGSGGYGLVTAKHTLDGYWNVKWCCEEDELNYQMLGAVEMHETDLVVKSVS